ncbi:Hypothetical predicted protein, partial [Paramuricea clavata]
VKRVKLEVLRDDKSRQVSHRHFPAGVKSNVEDVLICHISTDSWYCCPLLATQL